MALSPLDQNSVLAFIDQRVLVSEFLGLGHIDYSSICAYEFQKQVVRHLEIRETVKDNAFYVQGFLRQYISILEREAVDGVADEIYELFCSLSVISAAPLTPTDLDTVRYPVGGFGANARHTTQVVTREAPRVISGHSTTGMRTWEAALFLSNVIADGDILGLGDCCLELGAGTGLLSWALAKQGQRMIATDGFPAAMDAWPQSMALNGLNIRCEQLLWGAETTPIDEVTLLIAADVTYDTRILGELCATIKIYFTRGNARKAVIAATVRNQDTISEWEKAISQNFGDENWEVSVACKDPSSAATGSVWFKPMTPEIKIYTITHDKLHISK